MSESRLVLCGGLPLPRSKKGAGETLSLNIGGGPGDVRLQLTQFSDAMRGSLSPLAEDLLELCSYVYVADQSVRRGGKKHFDYGDKWHRRLCFRMPVRRLDVWSRGEVRDALRALLEFLTDDEYDFEFVKRAGPTGTGRFLFDEVGPEEGARFDEVCLFSGGLDSLCGAVEEILVGRRRVLLVSHRPENRIYSRQKKLVGDIQARLPERGLKPFHFAAAVNKGKKLNRDFTQRSRSFLFASMAAVLARLFNLSRVRFYENGVTSLNLPISPQMIGGRASRTTHPQSLRRFSDLFSLLFETEFKVENPCQWLTKPEMLKRLASTGHSDLCAETSSCVHTWTRTEHHPHCGRCSQCVDRRISVLAAGLADSHDPNSGYENDVVIGERHGEDLVFVERYVGSTFDMDRIATPREFAARFGEVAHVISHTGMPAGQTIEKVHELYRRHSREVGEALQQAIAANSCAVSRQSYPARSLLGASVGRTDPATDRVPVSASSRTVGGSQEGFVLCPDEFAVRYNGVPCILGAKLEFQLLVRLHQAKGRYLTIDRLREDVWTDIETEKNAIQRVASNLRRMLKNAGITNVVIDGKQPGYYRLILKEQAPPQLSDNSATPPARTQRLG